MADDGLKFLCRDTDCTHNARPYCIVMEEGRPIILGPPHGSCAQFDEMKKEEGHEGQGD